VVAQPTACTAPSCLLNVGCGLAFHPGFVNLDSSAVSPGIIAQDLRRGLPFLDNTLDATYGFHVLEHLNKSLVKHKNYFCTFFDRRYLIRGLVLHESLLRVLTGEFELWILCMDAETHGFLHNANLEKVNLIKLEELECAYPDLTRVRGERGLVEYYFTCKPALIGFLLRANPRVDRLTYLDADLYFFSDHSLLNDELSASSIAIVEHRFAPNLQSLAITGRYNAGWISIKRDSTGLDCVEWWRQRCIEWCYDTPDNGRYGDQGYLDEFRQAFGSVVSIAHKGANLAPWNIGNFRIGLVDGRVVVDGEPLIFFHFHGLRQLSRWLFDSGFHGYHVSMDKTTREKIYRPYVRLLHQYKQCINETQGGKSTPSLLKRASSVQDRECGRTLLDALRRKVRSLCLGIYRRSYLLCWK